MIDNTKLQGIFQLFGKDLPQRHIFFATRQTQEFITPGYIKNLYREPTLPKAFAKFVKDYEKFAQEAQKPATAPAPVKKPVTPVLKDKAQVVTKDA